MTPLKHNNHTIAYVKFHHVPLRNLSAYEWAATGWSHWSFGDIVMNGGELQTCLKSCCVFSKFSVAANVINSLPLQADSRVCSFTAWRLSWLPPLLQNDMMYLVNLLCKTFEKSHFFSGYEDVGMTMMLTFTDKITAKNPREIPSPAFYTKVAVSPADAQRQRSRRILMAGCCIQMYCKTWKNQVLI